MANLNPNKITINSICFVKDMSGRLTVDTIDIDAVTMEGDDVSYTVPGGLITLDSLTQIEKIIRGSVRQEVKEL